MQKHIYFVRHAESSANADGIYRGADSDLTDKGREQAEIVAKRIKEIGVDALISSPYVRTLATAKSISNELGLEIEVSDLFTERSRPTGIQGRNISDPDIKQIEHEIFEGYELENHRYLDEENFIDLRKRANTALEFLAAHPADRICVVTHGLFLRILLCAAINGPEFSGLSMKNTMRGSDVQNTGVSHFVFKESQFSSTPIQHWVLMNWNDSTHLQ